MIEPGGFQNNEQESFERYATELFKAFDLVGKGAWEEITPKLLPSLHAVNPDMLVECQVCAIQKRIGKWQDILDQYSQRRKDQNKPIVGENRSNGLKEKIKERIEELSVIEADLIGSLLEE